jgi:hypothetical protein
MIQSDLGASIYLNMFVERVHCQFISLNVRCRLIVIGIEIFQMLHTIIDSRLQNSQQHLSAMR